MRAFPLEPQLICRCVIKLLGLSWILSCRDMHACKSFVRVSGRRTSSPWQVSHLAITINLSVFFFIKTSWPAYKDAKARRGGARTVIEKNKEIKKDKELHYRQSEGQSERGVGGVDGGVLIGFQQACADTDILKGYSIWFVISYSESSLSLSLCLEEQFGYCCPQSLINDWIMPLDCESSRLCCLPNDKQQTTPGHQ